MNGRRLLLVLLAVAAVAACQDPSSSLCNPGQVLDPMSGYCIAASRDASADAGHADAALEGGDGSCGLSTSQFGDMCATSADCHCPTDYCAVMPGSSTGTCTRTGCDVDPSICPATWTCLDLGAFQSGLPHICYK